MPPLVRLGGPLPAVCLRPAHHPPSITTCSACCPPHLDNRLPAPSDAESEEGVAAVLATVRPASGGNGEDTSSTDEEVAATPTGEHSGAVPGPGFFQHSPSSATMLGKQQRAQQQGCPENKRSHSLLPAAGARPTARRHMTPALYRAVAALLLRLAGKAQFAKVCGLESDSVSFYKRCTAAYSKIVPRLVVAAQCLACRLRHSTSLPQEKGSARVASQVLSALAHLAPDLVLVSQPGFACCSIVWLAGWALWTIACVPPRPGLVRSAFLF